jgi:hypothetical protein
MLINKALDEIMRKNSVVVGFDLGNEYSQISYCRYDQSMPETISLVVGEEQYNIPTVLRCIKDSEGKAAWQAGRDAVKNSGEAQGILVDNLLKAARNNGSIKVGEEEFSPEFLLEIYIKKIMGILTGYVGTDDIAAISFTVIDINSDIMEMLKRIMGKVLRKTPSIFFLKREDCFFQYMIHQPEEMWIHDVLLYDFGNEGIQSFRLSVNRKTNPAACFIETKRHTNIKPFVFDNPDDNTAKEILYKRADSDFLEIVTDDCKDTMVTSVFLLGDYFSKEWCRDSLKYMCKGRRVFQGNNLFSKGACYGAREKIFASSLSTAYVYLSDDKLRANIGMTCDSGQSEIYYPILNAGTNWYDAKNTFDVMLIKNNVITFNISPVDGEKNRTARISLEGLKVRGNKTNRVELKFYMESPNALQIEITDKGFGNFFPSTGQVWKETIPIEMIT